MKVVAEECWSWMLLEGADKRYLSVACGSVGIYTVDIELNQEENKKFINDGTRFVSQLAEQVRYHPTNNSNRHIRDFEKISGVQDAISQWRKQHDKKP